MIQQQQRREEYYIDRIVRLISISLREFPIFRKWLNNRGNSFFHWFNRDLQRLCEQILLAEDGRSNISASLRRIFAAGMRRGRRILITIFAYSCAVLHAQLKLLFQRFDPFVPRIFAVSANRSMDSISRDYIMSSVSRTSEFLVSRKNSKILRYLRCRNSKFSILLK